MTDALGKVTAYEYDVRNLRIKTTYADHVAGSLAGDNNYGITECSYDALRRKSVQTDQLGDTVTYGYDLASRLLSRTYRLRAAGSDESVDTMSYDGADRLLSALKGRYGNTVSFTYDSIGRMATETLTIDGENFITSMGYDDASRIISCIYPQGTVIAKDYFDDDFLKSVKRNSC